MAHASPAVRIAEEDAPAFVLAHLSDPHVPHRLAAWPTSMFNKRVFGFLSWRLRRVRIHRREVLDALVHDLAHAKPDHVAVTGDVVNIALPGEFRRAGVWLRSLGAPCDVTVVPGNHDAYVAVSWERSWAAWREFMSSDAEAPERSVPSVAGEGFPIVRRRGPMAVIGLSTAVPTAPGRASGLIGPAQLERLGTELRLAAADGLFRVVLLHHPPIAPEIPWHKRLIDAADLGRVIADAGAELLLHGHEHRFRFAELAGPNGGVAVYGVPSASMLPRHDGGRAAQYHLHHIHRRDGGWLVRTRVRTYDRGHGRFVEGHRLEVPVPGAGTAFAPPYSTPGAGV